MVYLQIADPSDGNYLLSRVIRSDGTSVPVGTDAWTTDRTFSTTDSSFTRDNILHLLDDNGTGSYTLVYTKLDTTPPTITSLQSVSPNPRGDAVSSLSVTFSEPIDAATFDYHDLALTREGGTTNLITNGVTITPVAGTTATFLIGGLAPLTAAAGSYVLTVDATGVDDLSANAGVGTQSDSWSTVPNVPIVNDFAISPNPQ